MTAERTERHSHGKVWKRRGKRQKRRGPTPKRRRPTPKEDAELLSLCFCLDPDAPEGARGTNAYLFVSVPFDLYETVVTAEPEQTEGL